MEEDIALAPVSQDASTGDAHLAGSPLSPATPPIPPKELSSPRQSSSNESTAKLDSPFVGVACSSRTSLSTPDVVTSTVVYELLGDLPPSSTSLEAQDQGIKGNASSFNVDRYREFDHWGVSTSSSPMFAQRLMDTKGIASRIHHRQLTEELNMLRLNVPCKLSVPQVAAAPPQLKPNDASSIVERSIREKFDQDLSRNLDLDQVPLQQITKAAEVTEEDVYESLTEDSDPEDAYTSSDEASDDSQESNEWKRAYKSRERSHEVELADLRDDQAAEVKDLENTISKLQKSEEHIAKTSKSKLAAQDGALKTAKEEAAAKDDALTYQERLINATIMETDQKDLELDAARSTIISKDVELQEYRGKIADYSELCQKYSHVQHLEVAPLQQEVARLTALNREYAQHTSVQAAQIADLENRPQSQADVSGLQAHLAQVCDERDTVKVQFENCEQVFHTLYRELLNARHEISSHRSRLAEYAYENEDFPARGAQADGLIQKMKDDYHDLERKANDTFSMYEHIGESRKHDKIMHDAATEDLNAKINNLEALLNLAQDESESLRDEREKHLAKVEIGSMPESSQLVLQRLYDNLKKTVRDLKTKIECQHIQLTNVEGTLAHQRAEGRKYDLKLAEKESEFKTLNEEKINAQRIIQDLESKIEFSKGGFEVDMERKDQDLQSANEKIKVLEGDIHRIAQSRQGSDSAGIIANQRCEIVQLQQNIEALWNEKCQREHEQRQFDDLEAQCIGLSAVSEQVVQKNWEDAQQTIADLKRQIELIRQNCDPQKFDLVRKHEELREEKGALEQMLVDKLKSMTTTMQDHTVATNIVTEQARTLADFANYLCDTLWETWFPEDQATQKKSAEQLQHDLEHQDFLREIKDSVQSMRDSLPPQPIEGAAVAGEDHVDRSGDVEEATQNPLQAPVSTDGCGGIEAGDRPLDVLASRVQNPWEFIESGAWREDHQQGMALDRQAAGPCRFSSDPISSDPAGQQGRTYAVEYSTESDAGDDEQRGQPDDGADGLDDYLNRTYGDDFIAREDSFTGTDSDDDDCVNDGAEDEVNGGPQTDEDGLSPNDDLGPYPLRPSRGVFTRRFLDDGLDFCLTDKPGYDDETQAPEYMMSGGLCIED